MRLTGLLALLLFVLIVFFAAPAASCAQTSNAPAVKTESTDSHHLIPFSQPKTTFAPSSEQPLIALQPLVEHNGDLVLREPSGNVSPEATLGDDYSCFTMRSYIMARDDKDSDATHLVRQVKCTPARKFSVKSADVRVQTPEQKTK